MVADRFTTFASPKTLVIKNVGVSSQGRSPIESSRVCHEIERKYKISQIPEMCFDQNFAHFDFYSENPSNQESRTHPIFSLRFTLRGALKNAAKYHSDESYAKDPLHVSQASAWNKKRVTHSNDESNTFTEGIDDETVTPYNPGIDWTFRGKYMGDWRRIPSKGSTKKEYSNVDSNFLVPIKVTGIKYEDLRKTDGNIILQDTVELFEDDLHDCGMVCMTLRYRVMSNCLFIRLRYYLRIENVVVILRDVRWYYQFSESRIFVDVTEKRASLPIPNIESRELQDSENVERILSPRLYETYAIDLFSA